MLGNRRVPGIRLGWALVGGSASNEPLPQDVSNVFHTGLLDSMHATNEFNPSTASSSCICQDDAIFKSRPDDESQGMSADDANFFRILEEGISTRSDGGLRMPLPFRPTAAPLPYLYMLDISKR